ncbi:hypothetical protein [Cellulomonas sp. Root137]|uniref:hypothetical protein n=1 Tax=Cellulomonas sp. Root137 TaxID=1736459 RepID=UPI0006F22E8E|nr:hypothetical protein [Cellulomonas sp. Root137]KQY46597.1 hypothetical protein ASD18_03985 [Cellulomonas sp. Root137]KRD43748.1 hypothetical protein ASE38_05945 [Cellulomonas sp. Root930]
MTLLTDTTTDLMHQAFIVAVGKCDDDGNPLGPYYSVLSTASTFHASVVVSTPEEAFALARDRIALQPDPGSWEIVNLLH